MRTSKLRKLFCVVAMFMATVMLVPTMAKAEEQREYVGEEGIFYTTEFDIKDYWEEGKAPIIENCVFGGWYQKVGDTYKALIEENAAIAETAYAKFVPAYVLSVKAQNKYGTNKDTEETSVRIITSVDSRSYQAIGFEVYLANRTPLYKDNSNAPLETTRVYDGILVNGQERYAKDIFGTASKYVGVWELTEIINANYSKIIYVRPYWITPDGTTVRGLAKYVHIEDEYNGYVSVPVNVSRTDAIAAGSVTMNCNDLILTQSEGKVYLNEQEVLFEEGRIFTNMRFNGNEDTIKMVGYESNVATDNTSDETIFANIRFKESELPQTVNFNMTLTKFCNWAEELVEDMKVWDIAYEVKATTNE